MSLPENPAVGARSKFEGKGWLAAPEVLSAICRAAYDPLLRRDVFADCICPTEGSSRE